MFEALIDRFGDGAVLTLAGACVGAIFGSAAQHSRFCLRAAVVELSDLHIGPRLSVWFIAFSSAVLCVQTAIASGLMDVSGARQLSTTGSLSGAVIGGAMFGSGMILARGCASRLLVLSATGNLRAILTGLVLTLVAQASLRGALSPAREMLSRLWVIDGGAARNLLEQAGVSSRTAALAAAFCTAAALVLAMRNHIGTSRVLAALIVGGAVALGWFATCGISQASFEVVPISSITFTGPSTDTLMGLVNTTRLPLSFGVGLVPGVFAGAAITALATGEAKIERFGADTPMERYLIGACLMGFGSMLAGGCAVGAGLSGGAILSLTAWLALAAMWFGAVLMHLLLQTRRRMRMA